MKQFVFLLSLLLFCFSLNSLAQIPTVKLVQIVRAEDERRYDATLENLLKDKDAKVRARAALAAGRIGDERAIPALAELLKEDLFEVQNAAVFALGETESPKASKIILDVLKYHPNMYLFPRAIEAAGKIAAANPKDVATPELGKAITEIVGGEYSHNHAPDEAVLLSGTTAVLRARPADGEKVMIGLLAENDRIRANALNTLARLRSKKANDAARNFLQNDPDPIVRANAARLLGIGEDKSAIDLLLNAAIKDADSRVRVSAIRALGSLKDAKVSDSLVDYGETVIANRPADKSELLEIATVLGRLLPNSDNQKAVDFLTKLNELNGYQSPEVQIALAQVSPKGFFNDYASFNSKYKMEKFPIDWQITSAFVQGAGELANLETNEKNKPFQDQAYAQIMILFAAYYRINTLTISDLKKPDIRDFIKQNNGVIFNKDNTVNKDVYLPVPDIIRAMAAFKRGGLNEILLGHLRLKETMIRAAAAELLGEQPVSAANINALKSAFTKSLLTDKHENDAQLAILDALFKLDKKASVGTLLSALNAPDYLVRKKAFELLADKDLQKDFPGIATSLENARTKKKNQVLPYAPITGTKLGQILNTQADYMRAVSRKNGSVKAILTTTKGSFTIDLMPEDAPLTVDNFIKLARSNYFNGVSVHRVVPNFVMQDGDPRGDGNGGPGWEIRCEINMLPFERGAVGMALSGKDTGGSQWFVTHSPQPHLDGGYTVFGKVNEADMKIVDSIVRGDKILSVKIVE